MACGKFRQPVNSFEKHVQPHQNKCVSLGDSGKIAFVRKSGHDGTKKLATLVVSDQCICGNHDVAAEFSGAHDPSYLELLLHLQGCNSLWGFSHWHQTHSIVHISWKQLASMCSCHLQSQFHGRECVGDKNRGLPFCKRSQKIRPTALHAARQCPVPTNLQVECAAWDRKHNNKLRCKRHHSAKLLSFVFPLLLFCCSNC